MSIRKDKACRFKEEELRKKLIKAQERLHLDATNSVAQEEVDGLCHELNEYDEWKLSGQNTREKIRRRALGDKVTKEFYQSVHFRSVQTSTTELQDEVGAPHSSQEEMEKVCLNFYSQLYTHGLESVDSRINQATVLNCTEPKLLEDMKTMLELPITFQELTEVLMAMAGNKSPSPDGVIT